MRVHVATVLLACLLTILPGVVPLTRADDFPAPVVIPRPDDLSPGYRWDARTLAQHVVVDARPYVSRISLDNVTKPYLDIEIMTLMPYRQYHFASGNWSVPSHANPAGAAVYWSIPAAAHVWTLTDDRSGKVVTTVVIMPRSPGVVMTDSHCTWQCGETASPPRTTTSDVQDGLVLVAGAFSFTPGVAISVDSQWKHAITVKRGVTFGSASNGVTSGSDFTFEEKGGFAITSQGAPNVVRRSATFQEDRYQDGSRAIYATAAENYFVARHEAIYWSPPSESETIVVEQGDTVIQHACAGKNGGVGFGVGVTVDGVGLTVGIFTADDSSDCATMAMSAGAYKVAFYGDEGFTPAAWNA